MVDTSMQGDVRRKPQTDDNRATLQYFHDAHHNKQLTNPVAAARQSVAMLYGDMNGETIHLYNLTAAQQDLVDKHISHLD
jgi:hypothetical protein